MGDPRVDCGSSSFVWKWEDWCNMAKIRIDKYLADAGFWQPKGCERTAEGKTGHHNGETCVHAEEKLEPAQDVVCVQGKMVVYESFSIICCINHRGWCLQRKMHMKKQS